MSTHPPSDLEKVREQCRALVSRRSLVSAGAAVVPIPGLDMGTDVAILMQLLPVINQKFGLTPEQLNELSPDTEKMLLVSGASMGMGLIGKALTPDRIVKILLNMGAKRVATKSMAKFVPVIGSGISAGVSYYLLRKVGYAHIEECYRLARQLQDQSSPDAADASAVAAVQIDDQPGADDDTHKTDKPQRSLFFRKRTSQDT